MYKERANCCVIFMCNIYSTANFRNWGYTIPPPQNLVLQQCPTRFHLQGKATQTVTLGLILGGGLKIRCRHNTGTQKSQKYLLTEGMRKAKCRPVTIYQSAWYNILEDFNLHHCQNLKSHKQKGIFISVQRTLWFHWYQSSVSLSARETCCPSHMPPMSMPDSPLTF